VSSRHKTLPDWLFLPGIVFSGEFICDLIEPPLPVRKNYYRCDKRFHVESIQDLFIEHKTIGAVIINGENAKFYRLKGTEITQVAHFSVHRQKKQKKGGQSAPRFQRIRLDQISEYIHKTIDIISSEYITSGVANIPALIISGSLRDSLLSDARFPTVVKQIAHLHTSDDIVTIMNDSSQLIAKLLGNETDKQLVEFFENVEQQNPKYIYGRGEINTALELGLVKTLFIANTLNVNLKNTKNTNCVVVSGSQCDKLIQFGGIAAILHYPIFST
ncbi:Peptide chain release factor eRF/aRF, subunit 1, partial [Pacmanvirus A23]|uniref:Peptide chain release factor eRF/aRF, subunit 1 n=1 Tax=Pacmanvirus A23 TaxID=1932881 RepID=UPI000A0957C3